MGSLEAFVICLRRVAANLELPMMSLLGGETRYGARAAWRASASWVNRKKNPRKVSII